MKQQQEKLRLIEFIIGEAEDKTIRGLYELLIQNDYESGIDILDNAYGGKIHKELYGDIVDRLKDILFDINNGGDDIADQIDNLLYDYQKLLRKE